MSQVTAFLSEHKWETAAALAAAATALVLLRRATSATKRPSVATPADTKPRRTSTDYYASSFTLATIPSLVGRVAIVTGGNTGLGYHSVKHLAFNGAKVFLAARSKDRAETAIANLKAEAAAAGKVIDVEFVRVDLGDLKQTKDAAIDLAKRVNRIDILVNNAGIMDVVTKEPFKLSKDGYEAMFSTNHLGHFMFTKHLLPVILKTPNTPRIVNLSSSATWMAPVYGIDYETLKKHNPAFSAGNYYGQSKLANLLFSTELHNKYGYQIAVNSVHPGVVDTELVRPDRFSLAWFFFSLIPKRWILSLIIGPILTPEQGAHAQLYAATHPEIDSKNIRGKFIIPYGVVSDDHHPKGMDKDLAKQLWDFSEQVCAKY
ncbi:hypothetical protein HDU79_002742 [Rhizoclosmatium sp. JEL0117]|nr:hypothetical protein HDU79_002742 [Rhizoclosmatium sp. JEL0117]